MADDAGAPTRRVGEGGVGLTLLDGIALVAGAAIASVHLRRAAPPGELAGAGWALMWLTFSGVALTASGPFLVLIRRLSGRPGKPERLGDWLWALLGTPWVLAALPRIVADPGGGGGAVSAQLSEFALIVGLGVATIATLAIVWSRWVMVPPGAEDGAEDGGWTHRIGMMLAVSWPLQCGLGMVVLGSPS